MKIGGRVIQGRNIQINTPEQFLATYKKHVISVLFVKSGHTNEYNLDVRNDRGIVAVQIPIQRCTIRDAIIEALNGAKL